MALSGDQGRELSRHLIDSYFRTVNYPYTRHHIDSFDQFLQEDLISIIKAKNPVLILKDLLDKDTNTYKYEVKIYVGGIDGTKIEIGTPTISLQNTEEVRVLYPNEARLRNLTYASTVYADIEVKITYTSDTGTKINLDIPADTFQKYPLFKIPIMLHSRYCILNNKPKAFLKEAGECPYDNGGYFIIGGAEKVLITRQEQAFNTLYVTPQPTDPKISVFANISCLSAKTRQVKVVSFALMRHFEKEKETTHDTIRVSLPFVRMSVPLFVLFRAMGFQSDEEILRLIFPDFNSPEAKLLLPKLRPSILEAYPFLNTYTAIQFIMTLTKGFSEAHVLDIIRNQLFIHMPNDPTTQAIFLGDCVRKILRAAEGFDKGTDRDDIRNQRCLVSGFLVQQLFTPVYKKWTDKMALAIDEEYNYNKQTIYKDENFANIFQTGNAQRIFPTQFITDGLMRGFKGKWGSGMGEEKTGVLQALSRLSYTDFMSHCRRVILDFDTNLKITGPRKLHPSQFGYFCTSETPTGGSIGITKNLSIMTAISTHSQADEFMLWLRLRGRVYRAQDITDEQRTIFVPVYVNGGVFGFSAKPQLLTNTLKTLKRCGCLPYSVSITFSVNDRRIYVYMDDGRPMRPLIWLDKASSTENRNGGGIVNGIAVKKIQELPTWRDLVMGSLPARKGANLEASDFFDPLKDTVGAKLEDYIDSLHKYTGLIEYVDPYEHNECFIANNPAYIKPESTHIEVHPSTIMSMMTSLIPFAPHNQSPRNQLSCSQSKQGLSIYATNWQNRFDNTANILCYGEMPITRTMYNNYLGEGKMAYGMNCILAIACWSGYNQEDGIVMNYDAIKRGMFRSINYRSYQAFEEDDEKTKIKVRFGNPYSIAAWKDLKPGLDYSKLDERGIIREGQYVDENTVIVGAYMTDMAGSMSDASTTPQVWTRGRVEKVVITVNNKGLRLVKIRVVQDREPELGDKFCLTDDHEVLTINGWINIKDISTNHVVMQRNKYTGMCEWVNPSETFIFDTEETVLYNFTSERRRLVTTGDHRLWTSNGFVKARDVISTVVMGDGLIQEEFKMSMTTNTCKVYCISVLSEVFMVRYKGKAPLWTGNSNRHGQKGTIGALLRAHDMPRTESGIVPDMIMNPHAIPSRMTIAQNLEQLLGKTAALTGAIGDGTSFMNDGSPQDAIGALLEKVGFEKHGNEIMYNGATGEQIQAAIFIGPVYGMRLKHMVEDKWQARGKGRKEQRTHQPTGGRGKQGGLKIGEMDRDAIIAHGIMGFVKESFMERADGAKIPICTSCGTVPIYNPKLSIAICPMCDGPVRYSGDTVNNFELLPPLGRPKSKIVEVEMPYATKLVGQELETYLNIAQRYVTTAGIQGLRHLELSGTSSAIIKELKPLELPSTRIPEYIQPVDGTTLTVEQLKAMGDNVARLTLEQRAEADTILDESNEGQMLQQNVAVAGVDQFGNPVQVQGNLVNTTITPMISTPANMEPNQVVQLAPITQMTAPTGQAILPAAIPAGPPTIVVDTSQNAMMNDGIGMQGGMYNRGLRRMGYGGMARPRQRMQYDDGGGYGGDGGYGGGGDYGDAGTPTIPSGPHIPVTVKKLEYVS